MQNAEHKQVQWVKETFEAPGPQWYWNSCASGLNLLMCLEDIGSKATDTMFFNGGT